jgi:uncharacterized RDD family membrane protein YckC
VAVKRRLLALFLDYGVVVAWLAVVAAVFVPLYFVGVRPWGEHADLAAFTASVLPVWLYLTVTEAGPAHATWGKRRAGLRVVGPAGAPVRFGRSAARNAVKLLPWQLAHLGVAALLAGPEAATLVRPAAAWVPLTASYVLVAVTVAIVLVRRDRAALHDLVAGTRVVPAT